MIEPTSTATIVDGNDNGGFCCELVWLVNVESCSCGIAAKVRGDLGESRGGYCGGGESNGGNATNHRGEQHRWRKDSSRNEAAEGQ